VSPSLAFCDLAKLDFDYSEFKKKVVRNTTPNSFFKLSVGIVVKQSITMRHNTCNYVKTWLLLKTSSRAINSKLLEHGPAEQSFACPQCIADDRSKRSSRGARMITPSLPLTGVYISLMVYFLDLFFLNFPPTVCECVWACGVRGYDAQISPGLD
jgi:hypothetical protein